MCYFYKETKQCNIISVKYVESVTKFGVFLEPVLDELDQ